jgi:asparagine synthase (glutamine-hydrolysing)
MCGLAGVVTQGGVDARMLDALHASLMHRGPDGAGFLRWREDAELRALPTSDGHPHDTVGFAHRRLTIIDLTHAADQPMVDATGELALIYNGELYNYVELRDELGALGHSFRGTGDTEVVLAAYREWGSDCVRRFVGMWAFALLDTRTRTVLLSRDRFGIKPMYWTRLAGGIAFASEIKALLAAGASHEPDESVVRRYLLTGRVDESAATFFAAIRQLPAAHQAVIDVRAAEGELRPCRYWEPPTTASGGAPPADDAERFAALLRDAIRIHSRSDVPVGSCLSGGLDSSAVVCVAEELRRVGAIPSYAHRGLGYLPGDVALSERPYMDAVARRTGIDMIYVEPSIDEMIDVIPAIVRQQDEPFGSASVAAQWFVFAAAQRAGLKVMLDGQGADEYLAGYPGYLRVYAAELAGKRRPLVLARLALGARRRTGAWPIGGVEALHLMLNGESATPVAQAGEPPAVIDLLAPSLRREVVPADWLVEPPGTLEETLRRHLTAIGLPALLRFEDRNSMAHSIEARVPFLDHRLVEYALSLPTASKLRGAETKSVMRRALAGTLPEAVRSRRDKIGFRAEPSVTWTLGARQRDTLVATRSSYEERWIDGTALGRLVDGGAGADAEAEFALWRAVNLKLWLRAVVEDDAPRRSLPWPPPDV